MGTTKCGRYIRTNGANNYANDYAVIHSNEGTYRKAFGKNPRLRLQSGGHGETGIKELEKYGIKYNIIKTYSNGIVWGVYKGVRVGVMKNDKKISTIFPDSNQTSILRRKNKWI